MHLTGVLTSFLKAFSPPTPVGATGTILLGRHPTFANLRFFPRTNPLPPAAAPSAIFINLSPVNYPSDMSLMCLPLFISTISAMTLVQNFVIFYLEYFTNFLSF